MNHNHSYHFHYHDPAQNESGPTTSGHSKVIKGEIHNVLSVMRADPHYASPSRFCSELVPGSSATTATLYPPQGQHPLIASLRNLDEYLTLWELNRIQRTTIDTSAASTSSPSSSSITTATTTTTTTTTTTHNQHTNNIDTLTYLSPFCTAISSREVSAPITGAALDALHKFLLYGFVDPRSVYDAREGLTIVARAI